MTIINNSEKLDEDVGHYRKCLRYMEADAPIQALCLPPTIENILIKQGFERVYDLLRQDLAKIKGLGPRRLDILTARLDELLSVSI